MEVLKRLLREQGYGWDENSPLRVDHVDAMVFAVVAEVCRGSARLPKGTVGARAKADYGEEVLRGGYLVSLELHWACVNE